MNHILLKSLIFLIGFATVTAYHMVENEESESEDGFEEDVYYEDYYDEDYVDDGFFGDDDYDELGNSKFHCIWYGDCGNSTLTGKLTPCVDNNPARPVTDCLHINSLRKYCGHLLNHTDPYSTKTCCTHSQMISLNVELTALESLLERCPSCWSNMKKVYCDMTCSPHQSKFIMVTGSEEHVVRVRSQEDENKDKAVPTDLPCPPMS